MDGHTKCKTNPACDLNYFINKSPFKDYSPVNIVWNTDGITLSTKETDSLRVEHYAQNIQQSF